MTSHVGRDFYDARASSKSRPLFHWRLLRMLRSQIFPLESEKICVRGYRRCVLAVGLILFCVFVFIGF